MNDKPRKRPHVVPPNHYTWLIFVGMLDVMKIATVLVVSVSHEIIGRTKLGTAKPLARVGIMISAFPVIVAISLAASV